MSAHGGRHAHAQTHADAVAGVKRGAEGDSVRDRLTDGDAHAPLSAQLNMRPPAAESKVDRARRDGGDSRAARRVGRAAADRGDTTSAHAGTHARTQTHADAGPAIKRGVDGDTVRDGRADGDAHTPLIAA